MNRLALLVVVTSSVAFAQELKPAQEEAKALFDKEVTPSLKTMNAACGTAVTVKSDFQNYDKSAWGTTHASIWCDNALQGITRTCKAKPAYKKAIEKQLKTVDCTFTGVPAKTPDDKLNTYSERHMSFAQGTLTVRMNPVHRSNIAAAAETVIEKALD